MTWNDPEKNHPRVGFFSGNPLPVHSQNPEGYSRLIVSHGQRIELFTLAFPFWLSEFSHGPRR